MKVPELGLDDPHPLVTDLYQAMQDSAQARFFEPTDWAIARFTLDQINKELNYGVGAIPAMKLTAFNQLLASLLVTEGDRRRMRIEIERKPEDQQTGGTVTSFADAMRDRMNKPA